MCTHRTGEREKEERTVMGGGRPEGTTWNISRKGGRGQLGEERRPENIRGQRKTREFSLRCGSPFQALYTPGIS